MQRHGLVPFLLLGCVVLWPTWAAAQTQPDLTAIAPFVDGDTIAVGRLDIARLDAKASLGVAGQMAAGKLPPGEPEATIAQVNTAQNILLEYGVTNGYLIVSLQDIPDGGPIIVLPVGGGKKPQDLQSALAKQYGGPFTGEAVFIMGDALVGAENPKTRERVKKMTAAPRPDVAKALAAGAASTVQVVVLPTEKARGMVRQFLPFLPPELDAKNGETLVNSLQWISLGVDPPPKVSLGLTIQSKDAQSATATREFIIAALKLAFKQEQLTQLAPNLKTIARLILPEVKNDQLVLSLNQQNGSAKKLVDEVTSALKGPLEQAQAAAGRTQSSNNLKQLMLAMHNYHDQNSKFPARASYSKAGKPLLSWRVQLLPLLDQQALYREFHLDEPWDSEHNKKLIEKMPTTLASPALPAELAKKGLTTYLAPIGEHNAFGEKEGLSLSKITDGTSNTVAIVEASAPIAVIWTKPDDLAVDPKDPLAGLRGVWKEQNVILTAFCDGSVRAIKESVKPTTFKALLTRDGGEMIDNGEF